MTTPNLRVGFATLLDSNRSATMPRDPYPFPKYENCHTLAGIKPCQKLPYTKPTHIAQHEEPWSRLNDSPTLSSIRRSVPSYKEAPQDSLDLHLSSVYDNHVDFLRNKNEILRQRESVAGDCVGNNEDAPRDDMKLSVWVNPQKASIYSTGGAIVSHHIASTNQGYSRKHDGGFYST